MASQVKSIEGGKPEIAEEGSKMEDALTQKGSENGFSGQSPS